MNSSEDATATTFEPLWSVTTLAAYLGVPLTTIYRWNYRNEGPPYLKVGKHARYRREAVIEWLDQRSQGGNDGAA